MASGASRKEEIRGWFDFDSQCNDISVNVSCNVSNLMVAFSDASKVAVGSILYLDKSEKIPYFCNIPSHLLIFSSTVRELFGIFSGIEAFSKYLGAR